MYLSNQVGLGSSCSFALARSHARKIVTDSHLVTTTKKEFNIVIVWLLIIFETFSKCLFSYRMDQLRNWTRSYILEDWRRISRLVETNSNRGNFHLISTTHFKVYFSQSRNEISLFSGKSLVARGDPCFLALPPARPPPQGNVLAQGPKEYVTRQLLWFWRWPSASGWECYPP